MMRRGPGLVRTVARTAVVAGTASAVAGRVQHHQNEKYQQQANEQQAQAQAAPPPAAPAQDPNDPAVKIQKLAELHATGALTDDEFAAAKARILGI